MYGHGQAYRRNPTLIRLLGLACRTQHRKKRINFEFWDLNYSMLKVFVADKDYSEIGVKIT